MYYEKVFRTLQTKKVEYLVAGGMAVNLYGIPRFTKDLDLLIDPNPVNLKRLCAALKSLGYRPKIPVSLKDFLNTRNWEKWFREKGMIAFNLFNPQRPFEEIDLLIHSPVSFKEAKQHETVLRAGTLRVSLISVKDLIRMKRSAGRAQDLSDIEALRKIQKLKRKK